MAALLVAAALVAVVQLRRRAPPEAARLLPGADGFFYVNLKWLRTLKAIGPLPPVAHDADYEVFLQETDFQFERDLDEAAFAIHYPAKWGPGGTGGSAPEPRFSEVLVGKVQGERVRAYLHKVAANVENYHSTDIYSIPLEGRTLRVAILSVELSPPQTTKILSSSAAWLTVRASSPPRLEDPHFFDSTTSRCRWSAKPSGPEARLVHRPHRPSCSLQPGPLVHAVPKPASLVVSAYYAVYRQPYICELKPSPPTKTTRKISARKFLPSSICSTPPKIRLPPEEPILT